MTVGSPPSDSGLPVVSSTNAANFGRPDFSDPYTLWQLAYGQSANNTLKSQEFAREQMAFQERMNAKAMEFNAEQAQLNRDFQALMSGTAHQREVEDLRKAGLNPVLAAKYGGSSSPSGSAASVSGSMSGASGSVDTSAMSLLSNIFSQLINRATSLDVAGIQQDTAKYSADTSASATRYSADVNSSAHRYAADVNAAASQFNSILQSNTSLSVAQINSITSQYVAKIYTEADKFIAQNYRNSPAGMVDKAANEVVENVSDYAESLLERSGVVPGDSLSDKIFKIGNELLKGTIFSFYYDSGSPYGSAE